LETYKQQAKAGEIDLVYADQSGFCLTPNLPYAWQERGLTIEIPTSHSSRLNVFGFLNYTTNQLTAYTAHSTINSQTVIACIDQFCLTITKKTILTIDQAPIHTSQQMQQKIKAWEEKNLHVFFLSTYSPQLNLIEILWRFMKYEWIDFDAYTCWNALVNYVEKVIRLYGQKYEINFV
jgi:transposase